MKKYGKTKYRKSIVKSMDEKFVMKYGFEDSYRRFERSINRMDKEGDLAEELAVKYLKEKGLLSDNIRVNAVIALNTTFPITSKLISPPFIAKEVTVKFPVDGFNVKLGILISASNVWFPEPDTNVGK